MMDFSIGLFKCVSMCSIYFCVWEWYMKFIIVMVICLCGEKEREREFVIEYNIVVNIKKINVFVYVWRYLVLKSIL